MRPEAWGGSNSRLRALVQQFGAAVVWSRGIQLLGYPPTWDISGKQILELEVSLLSPSLII